MNIMKKAIDNNRKDSIIVDGNDNRQGNLGDDTNDSNTVIDDDNNARKILMKRI